MISATDASSQSPEPIEELIGTISPRSLLAFLKEKPELSHKVFHGFTARERSLSIPVVRQRLIDEVRKYPEVAEAAQRLWFEGHAGLMARVNAETATPRQDVLRALIAQYGEHAVHYGLLHAEKDTVRHAAELLTELVPQQQAPAKPSPTPVATAAKSTPPARTEKTEDKMRLQALERERETFIREIAQLKKQQSELTTQLEELRKANADAERRLDREQRRTKKLEEELTQTQKELRQQERELQRAVEPPPMPVELIDAVNSAIALLQRGVAAASGAPMSEIPEAVPSAPAEATRPKAKVPSRQLDITITLPSAHGKRSYSLAKILNSLRRNDAELLDQLRDGIALLADTPERERTVLAELTKAGIPDALLTGPLRPAVIDGSNVANINPEQGRARLAYLRQIQRSAWREGYFPTIIIVDASLRHQIDRADLLMELVESGEIRMAPAGTSADQALIDEAKHLHAVIITNDRMSDWPAAKNLDKRHVELIGGTVCVGSFHRTHTLWFR